ncbi:hypothetical protein F4803DRAFT_548876 [Xylaria telfairii]|nr:hypothetical protein F4803DRAFT_548876 [Xylaria telfairii]
MSSGEDEEPTWSMQPQIYPKGIVPSDQVLMISLYRALLNNEWDLLYKPERDKPEIYGLTGSLTGNSIWIQRRKAFFKAHREIAKKDVYVAHRETLLTWIQSNFKPQTIGIVGATQNLSVLVGDCVLWVDARPPSPPRLLESSCQPLPRSSITTGRTDSGYHSENHRGSYDPMGSSNDTGGGPPRNNGRSSCFEVDERVRVWQKNIAGQRSHGHSRLS